MENLKRQPPPPALTERHSGIPSRLYGIAQEAKNRLYSNKTVPESVPRRADVRLPPDTTRDEFDIAIAALKRDIGDDNVVLNNQPLVDGWYLEHPNTHDAFHVVDQEDLVCSAVAYPGSTGEVQVVVRWANKYAIPIYPISMGRNVGYGGTAPRVPGSIVVDLGKRMNKILNIDAENASCVVEPGVSYFALYEEVQRRKLPLWIDTPDLGGGSVLGNAIDRGVGYTPMGDHFACHCGMEIVLPNGEILRTGMGAMPGKNGADNPTWQSFQPAYGPYSDGIFSQSNFGIVCQMGFWLMHETGHQSYMITFPSEEDFPDIVEAIRPLAQKRILGNIPQLRHVVQELNVTGLPKSHWYAGSSPIPRDIIQKHAAQLPCGDCSWVFYGTQYGDETSIETQLDIIRSAFANIPGSRFFLPSDLPDDHYIHSRALVCSGVPILRELDWLNWKPNAAHLFFSPITPTRGADAKIVHDINIRLHKKYGFDLFPTLCVAGREMHYITNIIYDRSSNDEKRRVAGLMRELIAETAREGYGEYRTHVLFADQVAGTYNWNNNALMRFNETIKDALDPNGILAPGRNGIWPKNYRGKGWELLGDRVEKAIGGGTISPKL
ncbi:vanillyl alcohol oxidase [Aaosphaeria arxii CBS 175.79]|uniref:Vanillyl alcohol oxidase n=1 Tax=Aaosphaeria arxii CBS 175.79 TaxID=1450172 RepID=A0A6A5XR00_9PLEO|nr:vanillyl alcohol oxidase [Aaosphaeria arxii CBS 175.79]KAF2015130.1 vanillyl alcohol oxidase [Aaosphaeria arxii CBS 175.79]